MNLTDILESGAIVTLAGGFAYAVNKWLIPAYKGLKQEIADLRVEIAALKEENTDLKVKLAKLIERYAERTVLKSGKKFKNKRDED